ncbi:unnamed protein product, partial [Nesidiocoris tenuis]
KKRWEHRWQIVVRVSIISFVKYRYKYRWYRKKSIDTPIYRRYRNVPRWACSTRLETRMKFWLFLVIESDPGRWIRSDFRQLLSVQSSLGSQGVQEPRRHCIPTVTDQGLRLTFNHVCVRQAVLTFNPVRDWTSRQSWTLEARQFIDRRIRYFSSYKIYSSLLVLHQLKVEETPTGALQSQESGVETSELSEFMFLSNYVPSWRSHSNPANRDSRNFLVQCEQWDVHGLQRKV